MYIRFEKKPNKNMKKQKKNISALVSFGIYVGDSKHKPIGFSCFLFSFFFHLLLLLLFTAFGRFPFYMDHLVIYSGYCDDNNNKHASVFYYVGQSILREGIHSSTSLVSMRIKELFASVGRKFAEWEYGMPIFLSFFRFYIYLFF